MLQHKITYLLNHTDHEVHDIKPIKSMQNPTKDVLHRIHLSSSLQVLLVTNRMTILQRKEHTEEACRGRNWIQEASVLFLYAQPD